MEENLNQNITPNTISDAVYRSLFYAIEQGISLLDVQFDETGNAYDVIIRDVNPAQERMDGIKDQAGKRVKELLPDTEQHWIERYANVVRTGESVHFEDWSEANQSWYEVHATRVGGEDSTLVAAVYIDITERIRQKEALRKSEEKYHTLFESIDEGFVFGKIILTDDGTPVDYLILQVNPAYEKMTGIKKEDVLNRTVRQITPDIEDIWIQTVGKVATTGKTIRIKNPVAQLNRWFETYLSPAGPTIDGHFVAVFKDITERVREEQDLAFLAGVNRELAELTHISDAMQMLGEKIGRYFDASWCLFSELDSNNQISMVSYGWHDDGVSPIGGAYPIRDFFTEEQFVKIKAGETSVSGNTATDIHVNADSFIQLGIHSFIIVPLVRDDGIWKFMISILDNKPRDWQKEDVNLMKELAASIWTRLEKARAEETLRYSETRLRVVTRASGMGTWIRYLTEDRIETDEKTHEIFGVPLENYSLADSIHLVVHPDDLSSFTDAFEAAIDPGGNGMLNIEFRIIRPNDGALRWLHSIGQTFFEGEPKKPLMMVGSTVDITGRREDAEALRASEQRYRAIVNQATAAVSELDTEGYITLTNDIFSHMLGYTGEEMLQLHVHDFTHPESLPVCLENFAKAVESGQSSTMEKKLICKDGSHIWVTESIASLPDENGTTRGVVTVGIDITERKKTELLVHENAERYRIALEAGELATWDWNLKTDKVIWNQQHFRLFGIQHGEDTIEPEFFLSFVYPEDVALVKQQLAEVLGSKGVYSAEFRIRRQDNYKLRWMTGYGRVTEHENGRPVRVSGVMFDSTERREAEENLEATKNSLSTALEAAKMGVWTMDMTHGYMDRSQKHDQLLGYSTWQEDWSHEKAKAHIAEEDKAIYDAAVENLMENGIFDLEIRIRNKEGHICWVRYFGRAFRNEDGKGETAAGVIFDITDQKTIEKQKDEFIGVASHELKTPVTSIKAYAEILQEMFTEKEDYGSAELMKKLDGQVDRLANLIRDLLDVTKIQEGQLHLTTTTFDIKTMIENVMEDVQRTTRQHRIRMNLSSPLPEVAGDKERLAQVLVNMLSNAIKYSPGGKEVVITALYDEDKVRISVQDFGIGMSPGTLEKLFARFFRSENPSVRSFPGLGLGLFISMEIMKRHRGTISVESEQGKGSIFTMILPVA